MTNAARGATSHRYYLQIQSSSYKPYYHIHLVFDKIGRIKFMYNGNVMPSTFGYRDIDSNGWYQYTICP